MVITINSYSIRGDAFGNYLRNKGIAVEHITIFKMPKKLFQSKLEVICLNVWAFLKLLPHSFKIMKNEVYCSGAQFAVLFLHRIMKFVGKGNLYIHNFYIHSMGNRKVIKRVLSFLLNNDKLSIIVQTPKEKDYFENLSNKVKVSFVPYCSDIFPSTSESEVNDYIFTGGYTNRDYALIDNLAKMFMEQPFVVVASHLNKDIAALPNNVTVYKDIPPSTFYELLSKSRIVIVPIKEDVGASEQMLCLSAMRYRKPIIYTDVSSINYYFSSDAGLPYCIGEIESLADALKNFLENSKLREDCANKAYIESKKFTIAECYKSIATIMGVDDK